MAPPLLGIGFAVLAALGLAVQSLAVRLGTRTHSVVDVIAVMFAVNLLILVPIVGVVEYPQYGVTLDSLFAFAVAGILGSLVARVCYFVGIARIGASRTEPLKALFPLVAVAAAVVVLDEQLTAQLLAGIALVLAGSLAVVTEARTSPTTATGRRLWVDLLFPLTAALFLGIDPIFTKLGLATGTPPMVGVTIRIAAGAVGFGLYLAWRAVGDGRVPSVAGNRWLIVASVANTVYLSAYYAALARTPVAVVTPVLGTSTLLVVAGAAIFLQADERVTWKLGGATAVVVAGILLVVQA
ncbi:DMT family transporter [Halonotius roseus]|uniref:DMT family transporter n=1 Tax=Halonotius roseus TaxID=2511997 RepID=A0A544QR74_9EURY|nr:EamA family transporter [Halonotius roseus]TQQ81943.1 DMT family transporter [Halonotius roseus]